MTIAAVLPILLTVLKILAIVLAAILLLAILLVLLVLFMPICYRVEGTKDRGGFPRASACVSWFGLKLFRAYFEDKRFRYVVSIPFLYRYDSGEDGDEPEDSVPDVAGIGYSPSNTGPNNGDTPSNIEYSLNNKANSLSKGDEQSRDYEASKVDKTSKDDGASKDDEISKEDGASKDDEISKADETSKDDEISKADETSKEYDTSKDDEISNADTLSNKEDDLISDDSRPLGLYGILERLVKSVIHIIGLLYGGIFSVLNKLISIYKGLISIVGKLFTAFHSFRDGFFIPLIEGRSGPVRRIRDIFRKLKRIKAFWEDDLTRYGVGVITGDLKKIFSVVKPKRLKGNLEFAFEDPSTTGLVLAGMSVLYPVYRKHFTFTYEFDKSYLSFVGDVRGHFALFPFVIIAVRLLMDKKMRMLYKRFKKLRSSL